MENLQNLCVFGGVFEALCNAFPQYFPHDKEGIKSSVRVSTVVGYPPGVEPTRHETNMSTLYPLFTPALL